MQQGAADSPARKDVRAKGGIMSALRRFTGRMIQPRNERSKISSGSGKGITVVSTRHGVTELDADELYDSPPVRSFVEQVRKNRKAPKTSD